MPTTALIPPERTVALGFVTGMVAALPHHGIPPGPLFQAVGLGACLGREPPPRIPLQAYAALYNRVVESLGDEGFGLFSRALRPGCFEFLCRSLMGAPNLGEALDRTRRFLELVLPDLQMRLEIQGPRARLLLWESRDLRNQGGEAGRVFAYEWLLRLIHGLGSWLVARGLALDQVAFPYPEPPHGGDYRAIYTARPRFNHHRLEAELAADLLDLPLRRNEADLAAFLVGAPGRISTLYRRDRETVQAVRDSLQDALPASLSLEEVARHLYLSPRTLHRRLAEELSSFRAVKEALRRDLALSRLMRSDQPVARIAQDLGYGDSSAFYRACLAWTGRSPTAYRKWRQQPPAVPLQEAAGEECSGAGGVKPGRPGSKK